MTLSGQQFFKSSPLVIIAAVLLLLMLAGAVLGPLISPWDGEAMDFEALEAPPSLSHWFGTEGLASLFWWPSSLSR